jgi:hypothetical protein
MRKTPTQEPEWLTEARLLLIGCDISTMSKDIGLHKNTLYNIARGMSKDITASTYEAIKGYCDGKHESTV